MIEKTPLTSKKFIAFFFAMIIIAGILITALVTQTFAWSMALFMSIGIMAIAFMSIGYVLSQGALDKFVRGLEQLKGKQEDETTSEESME